jgi:hypothetical protein
MRSGRHLCMVRRVHAGTHTVKRVAAQDGAHNNSLDRSGGTTQRMKDEG